eukprot:gene12872-biopygen8910
MNAKSASGATPAHWAADKGQPGCLIVLAELGADMNAKAATGGTPAHGAAAMGQPGCLSVLAELGA